MRVNFSIPKIAKDILEDATSLNVLFESDRTNRNITFTQSEMKVIVERWLKEVIAEISEDAEWYATCDASNFHRYFEKAMTEYVNENQKVLIARYNAK